VIYGSPYDTITRGEHEFSVCSSGRMLASRGPAPIRGSTRRTIPRRAVEPERMPYVDDPFDIA
jgi:hypothetical protein